MVLKALMSPVVERSHIKPQPTGSRSLYQFHADLQAELHEQPQCCTVVTYDQEVNPLPTSPEFLVPGG